MNGVVAAWRWWRGWPGKEVVIAVVLAVVLTYGSYGEGHPRALPDQVQFRGNPIPHPTAALALVAVACLALAWRRCRPVAALAVSVAAVAAYSLLGYVNGAAAVAPMLALYAVATQVGARKALISGVVTIGVLLAATAARNPFGYITGGAFYVLFGVGAVALFGGIAVANRRAYVASIQARAEQDARRRIDEERLRIARELHDVVAHTMATINVQAGVAAHVLATRPEAVADSLQAIKAASKDGLRELRAILNVLRQADDADPTQPAPGVAQLKTLIEGARRAGLETRLTVTGTQVPLPAAVDLAAYRIVQESLTNTIRHAGPATAAVSLRYQPDELDIEVTDTGRGQASPAVASGGGHGLVGMRERAASVGGTVETGPRPGGGYRVAARLPLGGRLPDAPIQEPEAAPEGARP